MANALRIPLEELSSSNIKAAGYDRDRHILAVQFSNGSIFNYWNVTPDMALAFYAAPSKGRHFAQHIKGHLPGQKMTGKCRKCGNEPGWIGETCDSCGTAQYEDVPKERTDGAR